MTTNEAIRCLDDADGHYSLLDLAEAIATVCDDSDSSLAHILLGLRHPGTVRECAAIELHRRTGRPLSPSQTIILDDQDWRSWLAQATTSSATSRS